MSGLFNKASLVLVPSGYKSGKVYSQVPTNGDGDLSFTRSNDTATRVNSDGLIEKVRTNLVLQSNSFDTTWLSVNADTPTGGQSGYDGSNDAWLLNSTGTEGRVTQSISQGNVQSFSVYAKANTNNWICIIALTSPIVRANFDLNPSTTGSRIGVTANDIDTDIEDVGNGWFRCSVTYNATISGVNIYSIVDDNVFTGTGSIYIQDAQLETGDIATEYIPTTSSAVSVGMTANVPRLDYTGGGCPKLLLEPQRTNLVRYSEQFDNAAWFKEFGNSVTANTIASPDGYTNADTATATSTNAINIYQSYTSASSSLHTFSIFLKKNNLSEIEIYIFSAGFLARGNVNLDNGTITNIDGSNATITNYGNGWYRCSVQATITSGTNFTIGWYSASTTGSRSVYAYGAQLEVGSYATSYIPTLSAASTRGSDACSKTGISSLIGQTEGVVFWDIEVETLSATGNENILNIDAGSFGNTIYFSKGANGLLYAEVYVTGVAQCSFIYSLPSVGRYKMALAYKANDFAFYVNGVSRGTDSSGSVPATSRLQMGNGVFGPGDGKVNQAILFKTRLTNAELATLTTL
jgi:hypothetical protein